MTMLFRGKTECGLCGAVIEENQEVVAFPAFLPADHVLRLFSDAAFHQTCFDDSQEREAVQKLYQRYERIWASRPKELTKLDDIERWGREAFKDFP